MATMKFYTEDEALNKLLGEKVLRYAMNTKPT